MSEKRKRVLVVGLLAILIVSALYAFSEDERPSLSWIAVASGIWSCAVWICPGEAALSLWAWRKLFTRLAFVALVCFSAATGADFAAERWLNDKERLKLRQEHAMAIEAVQAARWYIEPAEGLYREVLALRQWTSDVRRKAQAIEGFGNWDWKNFHIEKLQEILTEADQKLPEPFYMGMRKPDESSAGKDSFEDVVQSYRAAQQMGR